MQHSTPPKTDHLATNIHHGTITNATTTNDNELTLTITANNTEYTTTIPIDCAFTTALEVYGNGDRDTPSSFTDTNTLVCDTGDTQSIAMTAPSQRWALKHNILRLHEHQAPHISLNPWAAGLSLTLSLIAATAVLLIEPSLSGTAGALATTAVISFITIKYLLQLLLCIIPHQTANRTEQTSSQ